MITTVSQLERNTADGIIALVVARDDYKTRAERDAAQELLGE